MNTYSNLPVLAMRGNFFFPNVKAKVEVARTMSRNAIKFALENGGNFFMVSQIDAAQSNPIAQSDFYEVGVVAEVVGVEKDDEESLLVSVHTLLTARISRYNASDNIIFADVEPIEYTCKNDLETRALFEKTVRTVAEFAEVNKNAAKLKGTFNNVSNIDYVAFTNVVANEVVTQLPKRQSILENTDIDDRMEQLCVYMLTELDFVKVEKRIANRVQRQVQDGQKEYYLREQMKAISAELGEDANEKQEYLDRIKAAHMPPDVEAKALKELNRIPKMAPTSPDAAVIRNYLDWLCDMPWDKETEDNKDMALARQILDEDHYGLEKIKERIVEFLAVMQLTGKLNGPILCFVGPPGVGKTSIVKSIARALNRKYLRVSLGGVYDEVEIRGHRRTYVGAIPGKIISMMRQAGCLNPVMLLDEIDKLGHNSYHGDPSSAMLEVLDPEQNFSFTDHYLDVPYDLSKVLFVCTANATDDIPEPLLDRMEVIELSGYTEPEKVEIANKFLLRKNMALHGIPDGALKISNDAYSKIIEMYTSESGVRNLEREIAAICRKVALKLVENPDEVCEVTPENLYEYLGKEKYKEEMAIIPDSVGSARGLAWTRVGGVTLNVDAVLFDGKGEIQLTGNLGDVMKESARTAISLVKSLSDQYGIDKSRFEKTDIHIHVPEGAIPKDGPSAGVTMATVVMSAFANVPVSGKVAMTGEITLRGKVLPIGGLREKALAAYRIGIRKVIIPKDNEKDLEEIPAEIKNQIEFVLADTIADVYNCALVR